MQKNKELSSNEKVENLLEEIRTNPRWQLFFYIMRIVTLVMIGVLIYIMVKEIEAVKILSYDPCKICMAKSDATCWVAPGF